MTELEGPKADPIDYAFFQRTAPEALAALAALGKAVDEAGLEKALTELVKLRVSQINGCAFCVAFHLNIARRIGVENPKLDLVSVWRDSAVFSAREREALGWAEALTTMAAQGAPSPEPSAEFSPREVLRLTVAIAHINAWNRIAGGLHFAPPALH
ncbi:alkylhydroperoxidase [Aureimonas ureilytica]|uniref:Alkylhydroperoxidase n=1 Tax=Aureimonas ureilytica TaxID=401562 RepID=A0A147DAT4_9HYPH|nr:carboxymuconolactone decarboxylase family protein [Aureimonas ureilytica]KTQ98656.1 alkylhydroperoxidase [Aureimonas ureilytica]